MSGKTGQMTPAELELLIEALAMAASRKESMARRMTPTSGRHHELADDAMRTLRAKLCNHVAELADPDIMMLDVAGLSEAERDDIRALAARR